MPKQLPADRTLADIRQLAASLRSRWEAGDAGTVDEVRALHARFEGASRAQVSSAVPTDADAELVTARTYGFATWRQLEAFVTHSGADPGDATPTTPLHQAAFKGHVEMAELLLGAGAGLDARDAHFDATPLEWAQTAGQTAMQAYLASRE